MYDTAIIGGGPAGYLAASRLAQAGKKVLLIEKQYLGGTCLNVGCIPTKSLLNGAKHYMYALEAAQYGVHAKDVSYNWNEMLAWKEKTVQTLVGGIAASLKKYKVDVVSGTGVVVSAERVRVRESGDQYETKTVLVAAGSVPAMPPIPGARDNERVVDSTGLLSVPSVPKRLCIIGGGVIGIEFASLFSTLGSEVSVIEMMDEIIPPMDAEQALLLRKSFHNTAFYLGSRVEKIEGGRVCFKRRDGKDESVSADVVLLSAGRKSETSNWGAKEAGVDTTARGVTVDDRMRTNISGIWAVGDVNGRSMLAHSAYRMAEVAVKDICAYLEGKKGRDRMRYHTVPWVVYSIPEAAGVGFSEQEALEKGYNIKKAGVSMLLSGRFVAENGTASSGAVKVIADAETGVLLGVHLLGPYASEMIWGAAALLENELRVTDVRELVFPHPTVCEAIREAVWAIEG